LGWNFWSFPTTKPLDFKTLILNFKTSATSHTHSLKMRGRAHSCGNEDSLTRMLVSRPNISKNDDVVKRS
jgi:hypothetical protein